MPPEPQPTIPGPLRAVVGLGLANLVLTALIVIVRVSSIVTYSPWVETTGFESPGLNVIAYTQEDWPPYRDLATHVTTAIYNFGFYAAYALAARFIGDRVPVVLSLRLITLALTVVGVFVVAAWIHWRLPPTLGARSRSIIAAALAGGAMMGPFVGWWAMTVRPDAAAMICEAVGLIAAVEAARGRWRHGGLVAALLFACAVSLKQTEIAVFATVLLAWAIGGRTKELVTGGLVLAAIVGAGLWVWEVLYYTDNIIRAAAAADYSIDHGVRQTLSAAITGFPVFLPTMLIANRGASRRDPVFPAYLIFFVCGAIALVGVLRVGGDRNYLFPSYVAGIVVMVSYLSDAGVWTPRTERLAAGLFLASAGLLSAYLLNAFGRLTFDDVDVASAQARRLAVQRAGGPVLVENMLDAIPWHSRHADTESVDWIIYDGAVRAGVIKRSIESRIAAREYLSAFTDGRFRAGLLEAGYRQVQVFGDGTVQYARSSAN